MVGTVKKSTETNVLAWLLRKVRQVCEGGLRCRTIYLATLVSLMVMPNFSSSPWMWGTPHRGLSRLICRIKSRTSRGTAGRPGLPRRTFQIQNSGGRSVTERPWRQKPTPLDTFARMKMDSASLRPSFRTGVPYPENSVAPVFIRSLALVGGPSPFSAADLTPLESLIYESEPGRVQHP